MEVRIVETEQELADAFDVRRTVFVDEQNVPEEEEIDQHESEAVHFVLYNEGKAAGAGRFRVLDGIGKVERICVLKENRKSGSGVAVMNKIEEYAKTQGITTLKLNAQTHALPFYSRLG
ncbi:MAG: GNAT family N-acetyltransferase, partial [Mesobacillus sp.]|uniref:GNAT family N-acetyltransferase n=1 Tax=Mesobacillus sp. TaxID=2675271 RepID=UPI003C365BB2